MRPYFNQKKFSITVDQQFEVVIRSCREVNRKGQMGGTWITESMIEAYINLHKAGYAHSIEVWQKGMLAGGLYGIALGRVFFGESMFSKVSNASKFGFISIVRRLKQLHFDLIDCQQETKYLGSLGGREIPRKDFLEHLENNQSKPTLKGNWGNLGLFNEQNAF